MLNYLQMAQFSREWMTNKNKQPKTLALANTIWILKDQDKISQSTL